VIRDLGHTKHCIGCGEQMS